MASYIASLKDDLANGFSKRDLERLIGLPKNSLASILTGKRTLSVKSQLKIKRWEASEKPHPLELEVAFEKKIEDILQNSKADIDKVIQDSQELGESIFEVSKEGIRHIDPLSDEGDAIIGIQAQIKAIRAEKIPEHRNTSIGRKSWQVEQNNRVKELESKIKNKEL